jgi:hypothetical protein
MYTSLILPWSANPGEAETLYRAAGLLRTKGTIFLLPPPATELRSAFNAPPRPKTRMSSGAVALCKHFERRVAYLLDGKEPTSETSKGVWSDEDVNVGTGGADGSSADPAPVLDFARPEGAGQSYKLAKRKEGDAAHPYWPLPSGSNEEKTATAEKVLDQVLRDAVWRNVMLLHPGIAVYEVRVRGGWGMRWTLAVEGDRDEPEGRGSDDKIMDSMAQTATLQEVDGGTEEPNGTHSSLTVSLASATVRQPETDPNDEVSLAQTNWKITKITFRGLLEPIAGLDHEL